jgi:sugar (pentulose or hexulose) kinase
MDLFLGIDIADDGARAVLLDPEGVLHADAFVPLAPESVWRGGNGEHEQDPHGWWLAARNAIDRVVAAVKASGLAPEQIRAAAVSGPAGAVALLDGDGMPVGRALMPDDPRGGDLAGEINRAGEAWIAKHGVRFNATFGLVKLAHLATRDPGRLDRATRILHAADCVAARLTGRFDVTDWTSALRTGFDAVDGCWPDFLGPALNLSREKLPQVVRSGEPIGPAVGAGAREAGLSPSTVVFAGMTGGCAALLAAGAVAPGAAAATLGTFLTLQTSSPRFVRDPRARIHNQRHPDGSWIVTGTSRAGGDAFEQEFGRAAILGLDERAAARLPSQGLVYPLAGRGERFPLLRNDLTAWWMEEVEDKADRYAAMLEGAACVERLGWETLRGLGAPTDGPVRTVGGGSRSASWQSVRAALLNRPIEVPRHPSAAAGMAVLAASRAAFPGLAAAAAAMVRVRTRIEPKPEWVPLYEDRYRRFEAALAKGRG